MITEAEKREILARAYVPEHVVGIMTLVSGGDPFLIDDHFCCLAGDMLIVVGYPLSRNFEPDSFLRILDRLMRHFRPQSLSFIAPEIPRSLASSCSECESDYYYRLDLVGKPVPARLKRVVDMAREHLRVERINHLGAAHQRLAEEFIERVDPPPRVKALLFRMWHYVGRSDGSLVLNAWDSHGELAAFYVLDLSAQDFSTYIIGCHSKRHYVKGASDLLLFETIQVSLEHGKRYIHLGLGVNEGIRRFKMKWGGIPVLKYEMCGMAARKSSFLDALLRFQTRT